jgi:hypothetical protein
MDSVASANHWGELIFPCLATNHLPKLLDIGEQNISRLHHLDGECGIDDIAAGETEMKPTAGRRANIFSDIGSERDDIMVESSLEFLASFDAESSTGFHTSKITFRHDACRAKGFAREKLDLKPNLEFSLFAPDFPHCRARVALNHGVTLETVCDDVEGL